VAARAFMLALGDRRSEFYPLLLPHLCFNRHDVAEGVRSYSQDTWRLVMGSEGPCWVAKCMPQVQPPTDKLFFGRCRGLLLPEGPAIYARVPLQCSAKSPLLSVLNHER